MFALIVASSTGASAQDAGVLPNAVAPLTIPTPDGSGQVTEPSIVQFSPPWRGFTYWMVVAPYPIAMRKTRIPQSWFLMTGSIGHFLPEEPIQYRNRLPILIWQIQVFFTTAFPTSFGSITSPKTNFTLLM